MSEYLFANGDIVSESMFNDVKNRGFNWDVKVKDTAYYNQDPLGSTVMLTDNKGHVEGGFSYDAFGNIYDDQSQPWGHNNWDENGKHVASLNLYNGKRLDPVVGLYDYGFRDYSPQLGRFTTVDPIRSGSNWYSYVNNDPVNMVDPTGLAEIYADDIHGNPILAYQGRDIKADTSIVVRRDSAEGYYNDKLNVKIGNQTFLQIDVQSEATRDDPNDDNDGTLNTGDYKLTLLPESQAPSYTDGMSISGNGVDINSGYMVHPNEITNPKSKKYGTVYDPPDSTGCIVTDGTNDYGTLRNTLEGVGYKDWESVDMKIKNK